jgi:hypothetical protein
MLPIEREALVSVKCGGEEFFDDSNGIIRSKCAIHRVCVPMELLDAAKEYTVCCRPIIDRKPYFPETDPLEEYTYTFRPLEKTADIRIAHISDTHGLVDAPVQAAHNMDEIDLLVMGGDEEGILYADIDMAQPAAVRAKRPYTSLRRTEWYK